MRETYPVCWMSSARYGAPLDATSAKKWQALADELGEPLRVIGFAMGWQPQAFTQSARFVLMPQPNTALMRYAVAFTLAPWLLLWSVARYQTRLIVAQSPFEGAIGAFVKNVARRGGVDVRLIVENHNNFEADLFLQRQIPLAGVYRRVMLAAARYAFRHADALRVISSSTQARAEAYAPGRPSVRFMTWTDIDAFFATSRQNPPAQARTLVYPGVLIPRKGVHHLLDALAQLPELDWRLECVGAPENPTYARELTQQVARLGLGERVRFVGDVDQQTLASHLAGARAMVLPSLSEGLGRVVVEAMAVGTPVIASRVGGIPDMITPGENGTLVPPGDVAALREALRDLLTQDANQLNAMSAHASAFARAFFSTEAYVQGYRELFALARGQRDG